MTRGRQSHSRGARIRRGAAGKVKGLSLGLCAQALTLTSMMVPIVLGLGTEIVNLVLVVGLSSLVVHSATLGVFSNLAGIRSPRRAATTALASLWVLFASFVLILVLGYLGGTRFGSEWNWVLTLTAFNVLAQGSYYLVQAHSTRVGSFSLLMSLRLVYGVAALLSTLLGATIWRSHYSLPVAAGASFGVAAFVGAIILRKTIPWPLICSIRGQDILRRAWHLRHVAAMHLMSGLSGQSSAVVLPFLGPFAVPWAIATRIANGFQTVGAQVLAPDFDIKVSAAIRTHNYGEAARLYTKAMLSGIGLGIICTLVSIAFLLYGGGFDSLGSKEKTLVVFSLLLYWGTQVATTVPGKYLTLSARERSRYVLEVIRVVAIIATLLFFRDAPLMVSLSVVTGLAMIAYLWLGYHLSRPQLAAGKQTRRGMMPHELDGVG